MSDADDDGIVIVENGEVTPAGIVIIEGSVGENTWTVSADLPPVSIKARRRIAAITRSRLRRSERALLDETHERWFARLYEQ